MILTKEELIFLKQWLERLAQPIGEVLKGNSIPAGILGKISEELNKTE